MPEKSSFYVLYFSFFILFDTSQQKMTISREQQIFVNLIQFSSQTAPGFKKRQGNEKTGPARNSLDSFKGRLV